MNIVQEIKEMKKYFEEIINHMRDQFRQGLQALYIQQNDRNSVRRFAHLARGTRETRLLSGAKITTFRPKTMTRVDCTGAPRKKKSRLNENIYGICFSPSKLKSPWCVCIIMGQTVFCSCIVARRK